MKMARMFPLRQVLCASLNASRQWLLLLACAVSISGCTDSKVERSELTRPRLPERVGVERESDELAHVARTTDALCAKRVTSQPICNVDFSRLAAFYPMIDGLKVSITGYLVVDDNMLSLYATEEDYRNYIRGRSIDIRIADDSELKLFSDLLYRVVNVDAIYSKDFKSNNVRGKLGFLSGPFSVYAVDPRSDDQGIDEVFFSIDDKKDG